VVGYFFALLIRLLHYGLWYLMVMLVITYFDVSPCKSILIAKVFLTGLYHKQAFSDLPARVCVEVNKWCKFNIVFGKHYNLGS